MQRVIDDAARKAIEAILNRERRVEIIPTKDGIRILELRPVSIHHDGDGGSR